MNDHLQVPSDDALVVQARAGSESAWSELRSRHVEALEALARSRAPRRTQGEVDAAFDRLRTDLARPEQSPDAERAMPIRPRVIGCLTGGVYGPAWSQPSTEQAADGEPVDRTERRELVALATAFGRLSTAWQAVLWHRWVDRAPAAELTAILGRRPADVLGLEQTARRGLVDAYAEVVLAGTPSPDPSCVPVIPLLGAYRRGTLPDAQRRLVDAHLHVPPGAQSPAVGCSACRRHLALLDRLGEVLPRAIVPGLVGVGADRYRQVIGAGALAIGASALATRRSERGRRLARVAAVAAVVLAVLAAAFFIREPFGDLDSELSDLLDDVTSSTGPSTDPSGTTTLPGASDGGPDALPNRIELVFPGAPQGAVYVPGGRALNLSISLSSPAPVYAGATGTVDVTITNNDTEDASVRFLVRSSPGVSFDRLAQGLGSCIADLDDGANCALSLPAGATGEMALRFSLDTDVPDRLVVVPSTRADVLDVPVEYVPGLLVGQVGRGDLRTGGATLGVCDDSSTCADGERDASSAVLDLPAGVTVDRALLVWEGERGDAAWAANVGLIPAGSSTAVTVSAGNVPPPSGFSTSGPGVGTSETRQATGFRSIADVTDLVRSAGSGTYTVVRAPSVDEAGDGSWTLTVVTESPASQRRLFVVLRPDRIVEPDAPLQVDLPISGSRTPVTPQRPATLAVQASVVGSATSIVTANGDQLTPADAVDGAGTLGDTVTYDLQIASTEESLSLEASTSTDALRLASIGLAADIVP